MLRRFAFCIPPIIFTFTFMVILNFPAQATDWKDLRVLSSVFPPYSFYVDDQPHGVAVEKVQKLFDKLGHKPDIEIYPWARAYSTVQNTPNSILFSVARNAEREDMFIWIGTIIDFDVHIYRQTERNDIHIGSDADLAKYTFAGLIKDVKTDYLKKRGVSVHEVSNEEAAFKMLNLGRVDLVASDKNAAEYRMADLGISKGQVISTHRIHSLSKPLYLIAHKDTDPELVKRLRRALAELNAEAEAG